MFMRNQYRRYQSGDTIVEVMLVLAVLGLAISLSYATANKSLKATRAAQENAQATALLQSQVELLRYLAPNGTANAATNIFQAGPYCIDTTAYTIVTVPASCLFDNLYQVDITYSGAATDTFTLHAGWPDVSGQGTDAVTLSYRTHN